MHRSIYERKEERRRGRESARRGEESFRRGRKRGKEVRT